MPHLTRPRSSCLLAALLLLAAGHLPSRAQTLPSYLPTDGLVGWWPFNGNANDESGNGNHGAFNGAILTSDRTNAANKSAEFDGVDDYVSLSDPFFDGQVTSQFTISVWFKKSAEGAGIIWGKSGYWKEVVLILTEDNRIHFFYAYPNPQGYHGIQTDSGLDFTTWSNVVVTQDSGVLSVYLNGELQTSGNSNGQIDWSQDSQGCSLGINYIGKGSYCQAYNYLPFEGKIDDIGIWNRALTDAEVMALYLGEAPVAGCTDPTACNYNAEANAEDGSCVLPGCNDPAASNYSGDATCANLETCVYLPEYLPTDGLVGWWPLNGDAQDLSGNGHHGTEVNTGDGVNRFGEASGALEFFGNSFVWGDCTDFPQINQSVSVWFQSTDLDQGPSGRSVLGYGGSGCGDSWLMLLDNIGIPGGEDAFNIQGHCNNGGRLLTYEVESTAETWVHWAVVNRPEGMVFYVNGQPSEVGPAFDGFGAGVFTQARTFNFGMSPSQGGGPGYFDGNVMPLVGALDDIGIWNRALTDAEVMALYLGEPPAWGCTDPTACNYNAEANANDGSCVPSGCTDAAACNFDIDAGCDDGSCAPADAVVGCMEPGACNFEASAVCEGPCVYPAAGLADCAAGGALCGVGMVWDVAAQTCTIDPDYIADLEASAAAAAVAEVLDGVCGPGTVWDTAQGMCTSAGPAATCASDLSGNGSIGIEDLLILLSEFATFCPVPEPVAGACGDLSAVTFDGYSYPLVAIGSQCWFKENLRSAHYRNGDPIPGELSDAAWTSTTAGAQAVYNEDPANLALYGRLYNGFAVEDSRGVCPAGWHVPSDQEWMELEMELGMTAEQANSTGLRGTDEGTRLKSQSSGFSAWNGTNTSGFSGLPAGGRSFDSGFGSLSNLGHWWTSSSAASGSWGRDLAAEHSGVYRNSADLSYGFAIRCLMD